MNWLLAISFGFFLTVLATTRPIWGQFVGEAQDQNDFILFVAFVPYAITAFLAFRWPKCPACQEPTHLPEQGEGGGALAFLARPRRRDRECGYCGHDLTSKA